MTDADDEAIAVVVVTHQSAEHLPALAKAMAGELRPGDELAIVDNASGDRTAELARSELPAARVIDTGANLGFARACHIGADATRAPLLLFLNPDCLPAPGCLDALRSAGRAHPDWAAWQAAVLLEDGRINSDGGVVHYLGIGWAGDCGRTADALPREEVEVAFPSGAALTIRREHWRETGGLDPSYFMYGEDLDLGLRLWLAGHRVGLCPRARVTHGYEFHKGAYKWYLLERNRWRTVLSVYPMPLLLLVAPALAAAEIGLIAVAARQGWLTAKLRSLGATIGELPSLRARRTGVQRTRALSSAAFAAHLTASLDSPYLAAADVPLLRGPQALYWRLVRRLLTLASRRGRR